MHTYLLHDEPGSLGFLLGHLFHLYSLCELLPEGQVGLQKGNMRLTIQRNSFNETTQQDIWNERGVRGEICSGCRQQNFRTRILESC